MSLKIIVGSTNVVKMNAAITAASEFYGNPVKMFSYKADPGITDWWSPHAVGQPFGVAQTAFGAINRMKDCWANSQQILGSSSNLAGRLLTIGFENGLAPGSELGKRVNNVWCDICYVAVGDGDTSLVRRGEYVQTEFAVDFVTDQKTFDRAVKKYEATILPKIARGEDLYKGWTLNDPEGPKTREFFLTRCLKASLQDLATLTHAKNIIGDCVIGGMSASAGPRYQNTIWVRDLSYMTKTYLQLGYQEGVINALRTLKSSQCLTREIIDNGYETVNPFGSIPIVKVSDEKAFLIQRLQGGPNDPFWKEQLKAYCQVNAPTELFTFPKVDEKTCTIDDLKMHYADLTRVADRLKSKGFNPPAPSFALQKFIDGNLGNITPGTRDSEIHFLRSIFQVVDHDPVHNKFILDEFGGAIGRAIFYLLMNVVDEQDGLPTGADSRDIFADILYDAKLLTNALFWLEVMKYLRKYSQDLVETSFRRTIAECIEHEKKIPYLLKELGHSNLKIDVILETELMALRASIERRFLYDEDKFTPIDFIPGSRAERGLKNPITPTPVASIIHHNNPSFTNGRAVDPQSLAIAVLNDMVPEKYFSDVIKHFEASDSKIGIQVFVPISGKTTLESETLRRVGGQVVWPHVAWTVVRALIHMNTRESLNMAEIQRQKLMSLGCGEWYALNPDTGFVVQGGDPQQGFSASSMIMTNDSFNEFYSK